MLCLTKEDLSCVQKQIAHYPGSCILVSAGAGSGKTKTLTARIAYLVNELNIRPDRILAITFTNKAADEMKSRLLSMTGIPAEEFIWVRTFHSACFRILKQEANVLGLRLPISVYDVPEQKNILKRAMIAVNVDYKQYLRRAYQAITMAKNSGFPEGFLARFVEEHHVPRIFDVYKTYNRMLREMNALDFDDILFLAKNMLLSNQEIREKYQNTFDYILVDEFQDSNKIQNEITELLMRDNNLMVVGDDYQSIYGFRGSDLTYFLSFSKRFEDVAVFKLEENYRSTSPIVRAANSLIAHNKIQLRKQCFSSRPGPPVVLKRHISEREEARWVALKCRMYHSNYNIPFSDMAVLYRTRYCSLALEEAFRTVRIPYCVIGAKSFYESKEIKDILSYLISAVNPKDDLAFERILNCPPRGVGNASLHKLTTIKQQLGLSLQEATWFVLSSGQTKLLSAKAVNTLSELKDILTRISQLPPADAIRYILTKTNYLEYLDGYSKDSEDFQHRQGNLNQLIQTASGYKTIGDFLENTMLLRDEQDDLVNDSKSAVKLMTIHAAKGLEFEVVFVIGLEEGLLPHRRSIHNDNSYEDDGIDDIFDSGSIEEERRLLYVAMTRAKKYLHLSLAQSRQGKITQPSRFLREIPSDCLKYE